MILWRILTNSLPVTIELSKWSVPCSPLCPRCQSKLETITHVFLTCPNNVRTWFGSSLNINFAGHQTTNFQDWLYATIIHKDDATIIQIIDLPIPFGLAETLKFMKIECYQKKT